MTTKLKSILAIIPARGGSKGIPKKNIKALNGVPLIGYTLQEVKKSKHITRVVVSTDDEEIAEVSRQFNAEIPCLRPKQLSTDTSSTVDGIAHMINYLNEKENYVPDYICLLQCTSPLRTNLDIDGAIDKLLNSDFDGIVSVCESEVNPYWTNVFEKNKLKYFIEEGKFITRRQDLPQIYRCNGAIYIIKTEVFIKEKTFETENITGYIMTNENSIDIDTTIDFKIAEILMKEREK
ncbi:MAG: acylneuraminate cytidylyltransferase [Clostridia bacterium]|jgi:N-acylneuraminate cytidylyltransferase/CMP-N,N'-diacetyllegionaminic acid synthase|nr:acylneuraminate cytidylyltransferase [Clostridia bacterium]